eukprot:Gb_27271 [translate_table: standard]
MAGMCRIKPHAVLVPFPAQGHVNPMMQIAHKLAMEGFIITFVNTDFNHSRILQADNNISTLPPGNNTSQGNDIRFLSIPDGLPEGDTRTDIANLCDTTEKSMPPYLHKVIQQINENQEEHKITCLISDVLTSWALDVAKSYGIARAALWTANTVSYSIIHNSPGLVSSCILPSNGVPRENKTLIKILPSMPPLNSAHLVWLPGFNEAQQECIFYFCLRNVEKMREIKWVICNTFYDLEAPILNSFREQDWVYPVGPLIPSQFLNGNISQANTGLITTGFWAEELQCLDWLDKQSPQSVIYVSFGSLTVLNGRQLEELALGLEATQRPFLWVLRSDLMDGTTAVLPPGFEERIRDRGCLVSWAPQLSVLSHPSIACFVTHCGWNSTLESISMGVPMICWPYFADQFLNRAYVVEAWNTGLALNANKDGIIEKGEIKEAVQRLVMEEEWAEMKKRVMKLKESARDAITEGGSSSINFLAFANAMKNDGKDK